MFYISIVTKYFRIICLNNNPFCTRREQGNCQICYSAPSITDVSLSGKGAKGVTLVSNTSIHVTKSNAYSTISFNSKIALTVL